MRCFRVLPLFVLLLGITTVPHGGADQTGMIIDDFESGIRSRWEKKNFKGETNYSIINMGGDSCLKAESHAAASGLIYKIKYQTQDYPLLSWRWKVENILSKGDGKSREGDDYAARVYVIFPHWIPTRTRTINYIWANRLPRGGMTPNAYSSRAMMIAVESGKEKVGTWITEQRNVYEDFKNCFGEEPSQVGAIAIMTDTDNTSESAVAYYDDIQIMKSAQ